MTSSFMIPLGKSHHSNYNFKDITSLSSSIEKKKKKSHTAWLTRCTKG